MIKVRGSPSDGRVALLAFVWNLRRLMIGRDGTAIIRFVAGKARPGRSGELTRYMALLTTRAKMRTCEGETGRVVSEIRWLPCGCGVAQSAIVWQLSLGMIRIHRTGIVCLVARPAVRRSSDELTIDMTLMTGGGQMSAGQRK